MSLMHSALEQAIAFALRHDSVTQDSLKQWAGKRLRIHLSDWRMDWLFVLGEAGNISVQAYHDNDVADAAITGTLSAFLQVMIKQGDAASLREAGVTIEGDLGFAQGLQQLLAQLDIDWEGALAGVIGDQLARGVGEGVKEVMRVSRRAAGDMEDHLSRYLTAEVAVLPTEHEVAGFVKDVMVLRHDVERLLATYKEQIDG